MAYSAMTKLALVVALCMVVSVPIAQAITCGQVSSNLAPCIPYVRGGGAVPPACCNGIRNVNNLARTTPDRQAACNCLKQLSASVPGVNPNNAAVLPGKCGVNIPYKISPSTNCATVK
uniref:Non-specific lipid-transfer protein n=1 Tax=Prunus sargentii TaxID=97308 RepID=E7CLQ9_9ROSA|nr:non-specific lipid transfer protein [Prunus sargentii]ADR66951.1 non-specific lipid transfer protein [Prunus sargentii]ADR66952.1 non-specific lipid transfer protein [Prunus sargentii]